MPCDEDYIQAADVSPCLSIKLGIHLEKVCENDFIDPTEECNNAKQEVAKLHSRRRRAAKHYKRWPRSDDGFTYIPYKMSSLDDEGTFKCTQSNALNSISNTFL